MRCAAVRSSRVDVGGGEWSGGGGRDDRGRYGVGGGRGGTEPGARAFPGAGVRPVAGGGFAQGGGEGAAAAGSAQCARLLRHRRGRFPSGRGDGGRGVQPWSCPRADPDKGGQDGGHAVRLPARFGGSDGVRPGADPDDQDPRPDLRRRPRGQLRSVRGRARRPGDRPERLRRDGPGSLGVGPQAARRLAGARGPGGGRGRGHLPQGGARRGRRVPPHDAAAREAARCWTRGTPSRTRSWSPTRTPRTWLGTLERVSEKARGNTSGRFAARSTEATEDGGGASWTPRRCCGGCRTRRPRWWRRPWRSTWARSPEDRLPLLARHSVHDVAFRDRRHGKCGDAVVRRAAPRPPGRVVWSSR